MTLKSDVIFKSVKDLVSKILENKSIEQDLTELLIKVADENKFKAVITNVLATSASNALKRDDVKNAVMKLVVEILNRQELVKTTGNHLYGAAMESIGLGRFVSGVEKLINPGLNIPYNANLNDYSNSTINHLDDYDIDEYEIQSKNSD